MVLAVIASITLVLMVCTYLPLLHWQFWWVRGLDFPRLQFVLLAVVLLAAQLALLPLTQVATWGLLFITLSCVVYQGWWLLPYGPFYLKEVRTATATTLEQADKVRLLVANVLMTNRQGAKLLEQVHICRPHVVLVLEGDEYWQQQLDKLGAEYPHHCCCPLNNLYGMHLYSRLPLSDVALEYVVEDDKPSIHCLLNLPSGKKVRCHFLHPAPPSPTENIESAERDAELIVVAKNVAVESGPVIVMGDFNDVTWSRTTHLFRKISGLLDPRVGRGLYNSYNAFSRWVRWPLDHLFHSDHFTLVTIKRLPAIGSDHFPMFYELALVGDRGQNQNGLSADAEDRALAEEKRREEGVSKADVPTPGR